MHADASFTVQPKCRLAVTGIVIGSLLTLAPVFGVIGTVVGMIGAFDVLARSGISDEHALAERVRQALNATATGLFLFPVGIIVLSLSIVFYVRRKPATPPPLP
jgi:biopolymer transport protein ExbB/TolQ